MPSFAPSNSFQTSPSRHFAACAKRRERPAKPKGMKVKLIIATIKPFKLEEVREALTAIGVRGMMVTEIKGFGSQSGHTEIYRGAEYAVNFVPKVKLEIVVARTWPIRSSRPSRRPRKTGKIGDGKIFVLDVRRPCACAPAKPTRTRSEATSDFQGDMKQMKMLKTVLPAAGADRSAGRWLRAGGRGRAGGSTRSALHHDHAAVPAWRFPGVLDGRGLRHARGRARAVQERDHAADKEHRALLASPRSCTGSSATT